MSSSSSRNLMGLFSGADQGDGQSDDPLKYRAPREPRKGQSLLAPRDNAASAAPSPAKQPEPAAAPVASEAKPEAKQEVKRPQFTFSGRVRLFKLNATSRSYEAWCNGDLLGCVILLNEANHQLLIYDSAKQPQCTALLSVAAPRLSLTNEKYLSFTDDQGNGWSALFESDTIARQCLKYSLAACAEKGATEPIKVTVVAAAATAGGTPLESGDSAGILLTAHELGSGGFLESDKVFAAYENEVCKISLHEGQEEPIGGLIPQIIGCRKGDVIMVLLPPTVAMSGVGSRSNRTDPGAWVLTEITIAKVKKDNPSKKPAATPKLSDDDSASQVQHASTADRMAALAQKSGNQNGVLLADAITERTHVHADAAHTQHNAVENKTPFASHTPQPEHYHQQRDFQQPQHGASAGVPERQDPYAIAVVPGQEARSAYLPPNSAQYTGGYGPQPSAGEQSNWSPMLIQQQQQTQQSILSIQTTLIELHSKLDRMSHQHAAPYGMGQQLAMRPMNPNDPNANMRIKATDLIAHVTTMVEEYEQSRQSAGRDDGRAEKLQERIDRLTEKNEQLLSEKTALLEKHADTLQKSSDNNQRSFALQQDMSSLREENAQLQAQLRAATAEKAGLLSQLNDLQQGALTQAQHGQEVARLMQEVKRLNEALEAQRDESTTHATRARQEWERERGDLQRRLEDAATKATDITALLQTAEAQAIITERAAALAKQLSSSTHSTGDASTAELQALTEENQRKVHAIEELQQRLNSQEQELSELRKQSAEAVGAASGTGAKMAPDDIKKIMSDIFGCINDAVDSMEEFNADTVMEQVKRVLRDVTKRTLAEL